MREIKEALLTGLEAVAVLGALLLLPCTLALVTFGCDFTGLLSQVVLVAIAGTAILTVVAAHEGWYGDHLSSLVGPNGRANRSALKPAEFPDDRKESDPD
jgi:hypothetical protein